MSKDKTKGHEREAYGFKLTTSKAENGWAVQVVPKPRLRGAKAGDARSILGTERDGFRFEGEAMDWAEDWALENRPYTIERRVEDRGAVADVLDDLGGMLWTSGACKEATEADDLADMFIKARRRHDQEVIEQRRANRANYRLLLDDLQDAEDDAQRAIDKAKGTLKTCESERSRLRTELRSPQVEFSFTAALERERARSLRNAGRQTDVEEYVASDPAAKGRAAIGRSKQQAEAAKG
jgi:hypothetical protein